MYIYTVKIEPREHRRFIQGNGGLEDRSWLPGAIRWLDLIPEDKRPPTGTRWDQERDCLVQVEVKIPVRHK